MLISPMLSHGFWVTNDKALVKKTFVSPSQNRLDKDEEKSSQLQSILRYTQTQ